MAALSLILRKEYLKPNSSKKKKRALSARPQVLSCSFSPAHLFSSWCCSLIRGAGVLSSALSMPQLAAQSKTFPAETNTWTPEVTGEGNLPQSLSKERIKHPTRKSLAWLVSGIAAEMVPLYGSPSCVLPLAQLHLIATAGTQLSLWYRRPNPHRYMFVTEQETFYLRGF